MDIAAGITGRLTFSGGRRSSLEVELRTWDAAKRVVSEMGSWSSDRGINITNNHSVNIRQKGIPNLMVVTILEPPYVMLKCPECEGNERYEGFAIDLLNHISKVRAGVT